MTFSILARDPETGVTGVAIASRFFAVGAICPFVFPGLGAIVTQASGHPPFAATAEKLLRQGLDAPAVLSQLLQSDAGSVRRQVHVVDARGGFAGFTGAQCVPAAGYRQARTMSVAGNMLASDAVLDAAVEGFAAGHGLARRLLAALRAAHELGGDSRGQQAAALLVYGGEPFPMLSLRIDDDPDAVSRLIHLHSEAKADYIPYMRQYFTLAEAGAVLG